MKHLLSKLAIGVVVLAGGTAFGQPNPDYQLEVTGGSGPSGTTITSSVILDSSGGSDSAGWSYGVCHDNTVATLLDADLGTTGAIVNGGSPPDFAQINLVEGAGGPSDLLGYTIGAVISFLGAQVLSPGSDYELTYGDYELGGSGTTELTLCDTIGTPAVAVVIVVAGSSIPPTITNGSLEVVTGPATGFHFAINAPAVLSQGTSFDGNFAISNDDAAPETTQGFSLGIGHDSAVLDASLPVAIGELAAMAGGSGPDFFGAADLDDGVTLGCVYSFLGTEFLTFDAAGAEIVAISYSPDPGFIGTTDLEFSASLGTPPVDSVVVVAGQSVDPQTLTGTTIEFSSGPVLAQFDTGDTNQDGKKNVADPVYLLNFLFASGPDLDCPASGDADADGQLMQNDAVLMLEHYFTGGAPLAAPFGACGTRAGVLEGDCDFAGCP